MSGVPGIIWILVGEIVSNDLLDTSRHWDGIDRFVEVSRDGEEIKAFIDGGHAGGIDGRRAGKRSC